MLRKSLLLILVVVLGVGLGVAVFTQENEVPAIPGITAEDTHPDGCVNCHAVALDVENPPAGGVTVKTGKKSP